MVTVYFATNRNPVSDADGYYGERFHADGPMFYRVGRADLKRTPEGDPDEGYKVERVETFEEAPPPDKSAKTPAVLGSAGLLAALRKQAITGGRDVIVLVHGFANPFLGSLQRAAQIKQSYLVQPRDDENPYEPEVVVFSWPSNGREQPPWQYHSDRDDAAASGVAMARFAMRLRDFLADGTNECKQGIHLVAHSMGNWALGHAVIGMRDLLNGRRLPTIFTNAFLMAADEDEDTFEPGRRFERLPELARSIHVYHSRQDTALIISDVTKSNPDRLGSGGPKSFSGLSARIAAIDCAGVDDTKITHGNHQYYRIRKEVIADVRAVLSGRFPNDQVPNRVTVESGRRYRIEPGSSAAPARRAGPPRRDR